MSAQPIGELFVRLRPDLTEFRREINSGIRGALRETGQLTVPGLERTTRDLRSLGAAARQAGAEQAGAIRQVRTAREQEARDTVAASIREKRALEQQLVLYREIAAQAVAGSRTQVEANRLAAASAEQLGVALTVVEHRAVAAHGQLARLERGALAGSGIFRGYGRSIAFSSLAFIGAYGFVGAVRGAIEEAGDLNTQIARSDTVFDRSAASVRRWSRDATRDLGYARESALEAANSFGTVFRAANLGARQRATFSEDLTRVAAAISLARGEADPSRAEQAERVALAGRGRALRQYGIVLDETTIKAKAAELGLLKVTVDPAQVALQERKLAEATAALAEARAKGTPLQQARAEDNVTTAQQKLERTIQGTTGEIDRQGKAIAAHAIIMEQGERFIERYGASLDTAAGRSRRFHEGVSEVKEEVGTALFPAFAQAADGITSYIRSISEGGARHEQFQHDLADLAGVAHDVYIGVSLIGRSVEGLANIVGGFGNLVEILGLVYAANKMLAFAAAIRESRIALFLLGETAPVAAGKVVASEVEMAAGASVVNTRLGIMASRLGRLAAIGTIVIGLDLIVDKKNRESFRHFLNDTTVDARNFVHDKLGPLGFLAPEIKPGSKDSAPFGGPPAHPAKTIADATAEARKLRKQNLGEDLVYRQMRAEGYSRALAVQAIITTREHPGGTIQAPSPEDTRFLEPKVIAGQAHAVTQVKATLSAIGREIESGETITKAKAKKLGAALATAAAEIADGGFSPATRRRLTARVSELATELASQTAGIGTAAVAALRKDRADIRAEITSLGQDIAEAQVEAATAIADAVKTAAEAERNAVLQAKANLNTLGGSLSDFVGRFLDEKAEEQQTPTTGPLARQLRRLTDLIHAGKGTPELIAEAKKVEHELNEQANKQGPDTEARKERIQRRLADLTDELNTGKITVAQFNRQVTALLKKEGISYKAAGKSLGIAFADGFREALKELREQAAAIAATPARLRRQGTGFEAQVIRPLQVIHEQNANIARVEKEQGKQLRDLIDRRHKLLLKEQADSNRIARVQRARLIALAGIRAKTTPPPQAPHQPDHPVPGGHGTRGPRVKPVGHGPDPLGDVPNPPQPAHVQVDVHADDAKAKREVRRVQRILEREGLSVPFAVQRRRGDDVRARGLARAGGHEVGAAFATGIARGIREHHGEAEDSSRGIIRAIVQAAKKYAGIHSPARLTEDEIGRPLAEGIGRGLRRSSERLGADLRDELRRAVAEGRRVAREAEERPERPTAPSLRRATPVEPGDHPQRHARRSEIRGLLLPDQTASAQRGLLLLEGRSQTRLLERIAGDADRQVALLREVEENTRRPGARRAVEAAANPRRATREATATATHNLLGS